MKNVKSSFLFLLFLALMLSFTGCVYSSYPPRYNYGYRIPPRPPRVMVVRPAPRVVYRQSQPNYRYDNRNSARRSYEPRSNRNYRGGTSRGRSYGPR